MCSHRTINVSHFLLDTDLVSVTTLLFLQVELNVLSYKDLPYLADYDQYFFEKC